MLLELEVSNFALIDQLHIQFENGLNILTGETGAGKSIIIDAVNMVIGARADRELVRTGANKCTIQGIFSLENKVELVRMLSNYGVDIDEEENLIITREIYASGRSICRLNGVIVPLNILNKATRRLIDIHGQHEHQSLLETHNHIDMLDAYGGEKTADYLSKINERYQRLIQVQNKLKSICYDEMERERQIDLLRFQIEEIDMAALIPGEEEDLSKQKEIVANSEKIFSTLSNVYNNLYGGTSDSAIVDTLATIIIGIEQIASYDPALREFHESLQELQYKIEDITMGVRNYRDTIDFDPLLLEDIEQRLDTINHLKRKYGVSIKEILNYRHNIQAELEQYENNEFEIIGLKDEIVLMKNELKELALAMSQLRIKTADIFEKQITAILETLNMGKVSFEVSIIQRQDHLGEMLFTSKGINDVEFLISTNLGEPLKSLSKIASGGEMSRIMLAFKTILADVDHMPTLIFDEIDTGISGRTAQIVGEKLYDISKKHQVLCITHLPQIASMANYHYLIEKKEKNDTTQTTISKLDKEHRVQELGRLLGGELTEITLKHAEEMINQAYLKRNA
ncbi:DNA repair protein RecN [Alkaliphilus metalliredigens QYMF]|uniref:DNA repair protein RecN n=1 Tax=Alkaliphilus metalliredigens (strain QYMF) TaxID=293826 RepID=A6TR46_ALKMQ|nr:DNA repair protein RecN [Alkaliphilus metalliredigens]ABR48664.1 DNA repair protein RecN [Alkaliphilus metalliredigens QYMF]